MGRSWTDAGRGERPPFASVGAEQKGASAMPGGRYASQLRATSIALASADASGMRCASGSRMATVS